MGLDTIALRLVIGGDSKGAKAALKSLGTEGGRAGKALKAAQTGAAIGLTAIVGVAAKGVQQYTLLTTSVAALGRQSKVSAEDASLLVGQWQRYGVSAEAGGKGVMMLSKQIDAANTGTKTSIDSFARLGITLDDLKTMSPYQVLEQVRSKLSQLPPSAERTAISAKLLGKGFMSMSKWIAASSTDLDALNQQLKDSGQVMDEKELAKAKDDLKQMALLQVDLRGLFVEVGRSAMPIIRDLVPGLKKLLAVVKPLAPHLVEIGGALAAFLVVSKVGAGLGTMVTMLGKLKALLVGGKIASGLAGVAGAGGGGLGGVGGAAGVPLQSALSLNTAATEANTLALGGKGIPGGGAPGAAPGGGGFLSKLKGPFSWLGLAGMAGMSVGGAGVEVQALPPELAAQFHAGGEKAGQVFADAFDPLPFIKPDLLGAAGGTGPISAAAQAAEKGGKKAAAGFAKGFKPVSDPLSWVPARLDSAIQKMLDRGDPLSGLDSAILKSSKKLGVLRQELGLKIKLGAPDTAEWAAKVRREEKRLLGLRVEAERSVHTGKLNTDGWTGPLSKAARALASFRDLAEQGITPGSMSQHGPRRPKPPPVWHAPGRALGGYVRRTPGGTLLRVGEGKYDEVVAQVLPGKGESSAASGGDTHLHFHVGQVIGTDERAARQLWNTMKPIAMREMRLKMAMSRG